jgi:hypothetical protein
MSDDAFATPHPEGHRRGLFGGSQSMWTWIAVGLALLTLLLVLPSLGTGSTRTPNNDPLGGPTSSPTPQPAEPEIETVIA